MIIYNTTYFVADEVQQEFLEWLRRVYVPQATADRMLLVPQLIRIIGSERDGGISFAFQFRAMSVEILNTWHESVGTGLANALTSRFGNRVVGFATMMENLDV